MKLPREFTNFFNFILDNIIPPVLRDARWFMSFLMRLALGPKYTHYMTFKEDLISMTDEDIEDCYALLADTFISRDTDLSDKCVEFILSNIVGDSVVDVGCGKGYLLGKIYERGLAKTLHGSDYAPPVDDKGISYHKGNITSLPYSDCSIDTVVCAHTLEHIRDIQLALNELKRIARKRIIIVLPKQRKYRYTFDLHIHFFPYLFDIKQLINDSNAQYYEISGEFCIIINI